MESKEKKENKNINNLSPREFEKWCLEFLKGFAEEEKLKEFCITHNKVIKMNDGDYQIDVYAEYTALGTRNKVLCECKKYKNRVKREQVVLLHEKLESVGAQKGILISTSEYQSGAIKYAEVHGIALIYVTDYNYDFLAHSSGGVRDDIDDPFQFAEKNMPPYVAYVCTSESDEDRKIYPTKTMIKELYLEMSRRVKDTMGIDINIEDIL